ncbi:probable ATP-dependent RNA helicase DHX34 isoform X2 [Venturia canescens]|uniref:probable ATP-dependent RNA helicase DHX34 isoform X2 n=1 Tax=Venturia canescens TaxID=32260 RepID=UPI001C9C3345|nr:probable ATP-dependent RNA helicase DHX34 isoform X2 [Venturia canescens]
MNRRHKFQKKHCDNQYDSNSRSLSKRIKYCDQESKRSYKSSKILLGYDVEQRNRCREKEDEAVSCHNENMEKDYSITKNDYEFNKMFHANPNLVQDTQDFWQFVRKYESIQKKSKQMTQCSANKQSNSSEISNIYDKSKSININLSSSFDETIAWVLKIVELGNIKLNKFKDAILLYLDFKQKEKFNRLKKLRADQANLPVAQYKNEIIQAVKEKSVIIIAGDTGCGKSTQVPQYLYSSGFGRIGCTQPRRLACLSLAKRVAFETLTENCNEVGYRIRFEKQTTQYTQITFITEGLLLRQVSGDADLAQYNVIVLDEIHERHLYGDFLLGVMKCIIHQRPDLKLILMSATINLQLFSNYFVSEDVRVIQVPGRLYPIELIYKPIAIVDAGIKSSRFNPGPYVGIMQVIDHKYTADDKGDLLIFLSGMNEITAVANAAKDYAQKKNNWIVLPLHSTLPIAEQDEVFDYPPDGVRKCIISTNIAETSITIDGIRFVADSGKVKEMSYDSTCKMQRLKEFWISKASAEQRKGRAGRTGPGVCYRIYSKEEYSQLENYSAPEIQRIPLDSLLLQMMAMGLPDARKFPFIEAPPSESLEISISSLKEHGALTEDEKLTCIGKTLSRLPVDISIGKMLIMGSIFHQVEPVLSVAAALSVQNPFVSNAFKDKESETLRKKLESDHGDPITLLNAYKEWLKIKQENSDESRSGWSSSRKWCKRRGIEEQRFYEMTKLRAQFKELLHDCNLLKNLSESKVAVSSAERSMRHGELKLLKSLKRNYSQSAERKRKQLKLEIHDIEIEDDEKNDNEIDIKDVEFRMKNDSSQVQQLLAAATACSYKDLTILKLILCSGLYPQFAVADEFNYCKSMNEQLYHTKGKPYVSLHPMGIFGNDSQVLQLEEREIAIIPGYKCKTPISSKHQLLAYFMVCDSWLSLEFPIPDTGLTLLMEVTKLRQKWDLLLTKQLQDVTPTDEEAEIANQMEEELSVDLIQFMRTTIPYTVKRLLPADLKTIYVGRGENGMEIKPNPFQHDFKSFPNTTKGGVWLTQHITYNCLFETEWSEKLSLDMLETPWECSKCEKEMILSSIKRLQHHSDSCTSSNTGKLIKNVGSGAAKPNSKSYQCPICKKALCLTPIEILRHRKQHEATSSAV